MAAGQTNLAETGNLRARFGPTRGSPAESLRFSHWGVESGDSSVLQYGHFAASSEMLLAQFGQSLVPTVKSAVIIFLPLCQDLDLKAIVDVCRPAPTKPKTVKPAFQRTRR